MEQTGRAMRSIRRMLSRRDLLMIGAVWLAVAALALAGAVSARYVAPPAPPTTAGLGTMPGFVSVGVPNTCLPFSSFCGDALVVLEPEEPEAIALEIKLRANIVDAETFADLPVPVLHGRNLRPHECSRGVAAAVINESMARYLWPDDDSIGRRIRVSIDDKAARWVEIVGVVPDLSFGRGAVPHIPTLYLSSRQFDVAVKLFFAGGGGAPGDAGA